jgi:2-oxoglutarate dehydrogenase E1 component
MNPELLAKKDLLIITPFMKNEWLGFRQVTDVQMLEKEVLRTQSWVDSGCRCGCNLPTDELSAESKADQR